MATTALIQAALATARANDLDWSDMAVLLKQAITNALVSDTGEVELPFTSVGADGTSITRMSIAEATALFQRMNALASGGIVPQLCEFSERFNG